MTAPSPAEYLEGRFDRVQALRAIAARLNRELYGPSPALPGDGRRPALKRRLKRVRTHIARLTGDTP